MESAVAFQSSSMAQIVIRSRTTILELLERRGYNVEPYKKLVGPDLLKLTPESFQKNHQALRIDVVKKDDSTKHAIVEYLLFPIKQLVSQGTLVKKLLATSPPQGAPPTELYGVSPETTELIILYSPRTVSEENEPYDKAALDAWTKYKLQIQFFPIERLVSNPLNHMLQPQFRIVPPEQVPELVKQHYAVRKTNFPFIRFHADMVARCLGLLPGDVIEVTRPSPSAGSYVVYRTCTP